MGGEAVEDDVMARGEEAVGEVENGAAVRLGVVGVADEEAGHRGKA